MGEELREFADLRREIIEARNQAIKTDNQVKNLSLDIRGFEKRFDGLEGRVRLSSVGVNLIVAATIGLAAYVVSVVRAHGYEGEIAALRSAARGDLDTARRQGEDMRARLAELEAQRRAHDAASETATRMLGLLDEHQERDAAALLDRVEVAALTPFERRLSERRFADLRHREAEATYRAGRNSTLAGRYEAALPELQRALDVEPDGRVAASARYYLATCHVALRHYDAAQPHLRALATTEDHGVAEEARYLLAASAARAGKHADARPALQAMAGGSGRFAPGARAYLAALDGEAEMPIDLPGGRVRVPRGHGSGAAGAEAEQPSTPTAVAAE